MDLIDYKEGMTPDHFYFSTKNDLLSKILKKYATKSNNKILSIGCGTGEELEILKKYGKINVIDLNKEVLHLIKDKTINKKVMDARALKFKNNNFDIIVALDIIEHVKEDTKVVNEIYRVLKPKGKTIIIVPAFNSLYSNHDKLLGHVKRYNKKEVLNLFKDFKIKYIGFWNLVVFLPVALIRLFTKKNKSANRGNIKPNKIINKIIEKTIKLENKMIYKGLKMPFGLSIIGVFEK